MNVARLVSVALVLTLARPGGVAGQEPASGASSGRGIVVVGTIVDRTTNEPLPDASVTVRVPGAEDRIVWGGTADRSGNFRTARLQMGTYEIRVEMLGFSEVRHLETFEEDGTAEFRAEMVPDPIELEPIVATAVRQSRLERDGFFERRRFGMGYSMTRDEIEARGNGRASDLFRLIPGVIVTPSRPGRASELLLRGGCVPLMVIDGMRLAFPLPVDELLTSGQLEAIEVYHGAAGPAQYSNSCGTVLAWSRDGSDAEGRPWSWRRLAAGVSLFTLLTWLMSR